LRVSLVAYDAV